MNLVSLERGLYTRMRVYACFPLMKPRKTLDVTVEGKVDAMHVASAQKDPRRFVESDIDPPEAA